MCGGYCDDWFCYDYCCTHRHADTRKCWLWVFGGITAVALLITMIVLLAMYTNQKVSQEDYGVFHNTYTGELDGPYAQGTYRLDVGEEIITFKRIYQQHVQNDAKCLTKDKLQVQLDMAYQYAFKDEAIIPVVLRKFNEESNYLDLVDDAFWTAFTLVCANYTAEQFYGMRARIESSIYDQFERYVEQMDVGLDVRALQLTDVTFPSSFAKVVADKQTATQEIDTAKMEREGKKTAAQTALLKAQQQADTLIIQANSTAKLIRQQAEIQYAMVVEQQRQRGLGFQVVMESVNNSHSSFFAYLQSLILSKSAKTVFNFKDLVG